MNLWDYYTLLGIRQGASDEEIRRAYRRKALEYHPDRNHSDNAMEMFIKITEAYEYLISHPYARNISREEALKNYKAWVDYRQAEARKRAEASARESFDAFRKSTLYKSTLVMDGTNVFLGLGLAVAVILMTVFGYSWRLKHATGPGDKPSLILALISLAIGFCFLIISIIYLNVWLDQMKRRKRNVRTNQDQKPL